MQSKAHHCQWQHVRRSTTQHNKKYKTVSTTCQTMLNSGKKQVRNKDSCRRHLFQIPILLHLSSTPTPKRDALWIVDPTGPSTNCKLQSTTDQIQSLNPFNALKKKKRIRSAKGLQELYNGGIWRSIYRPISSCHLLPWFPTKATSSDSSYIYPSTSEIRAKNPIQSMLAQVKLSEQSSMK